MNGAAGFAGLRRLAEEFRQRTGLAPDTSVPIDAVTRSASGLDPHISPDNATLQIPRVARARGLSVEAVRRLSMPAGGSAVSSHRYDPFVQLPWSRALDANWTAAGMLSVYWPKQNGRRNVTGETTFLTDPQLMKTWDAFVEYAGDFPESGGPLHLLHFGTIYRLRPQQQIDVHCGVGLSSAAVDHFIGVGYSFRLQAVPLGL